MEDVILILNAGSSSLKFSLAGRGDPAHVLMRGQVSDIGAAPRLSVSAQPGRTPAAVEWSAGGTDHESVTDALLAWLESAAAGWRIVGAGHRVVHGGVRFDCPVRVGARVMADLEALVPLAPLHQPHNLAAIRAVERWRPGLPQVACFDTSFHRTQPNLAQMMALPREWAAPPLGVVRYGFHGLSYEYIASALAAIDPRAAAGRTIVAHLGHGASLCALHAGRSVATSMGFSTLDGLVMSTRCGSIDPGALLYLLRQEGMSLERLERLLYEESGLLGVSGQSGDMRELLGSTDPRARQAIELFTTRLVREIASHAAAMGGMDALVFTGGIGENAAPIRAAACDGCAWLGVGLDEAANQRGGPRLTAASSRVSAWVIPTNEELMIARHTARILSESDPDNQGAAGRPAQGASS